MNRLAYLLSLICILAFSSCEEDKVYYHTAAKADFTIGENMYELGQPDSSMVMGVWRCKKIRLDGTESNFRLSVGRYIYH